MQINEFLLYKKVNKLGSRDCKKERKQVGSYVVKKLLTTHSTGSIGYLVSDYTNNSSWVVTSMHAQMKHTL